MSELDRATALHQTVRTKTGTLTQTTVSQSAISRVSNRITSNTSATTTAPTTMRFKRGTESSLVQNVSANFDQNVMGLGPSSGNKRTGKGRTTRATTMQQRTKPIRIAPAPPNAAMQHQKCLRNTNSHVLSNNLSK